MRRLLLASVGFILLSALPVRADVITIEPDDYLPGSDLSQVGPGVTLSTLSRTRDGRNYTLSPVYSRRNPLCDIDPLSCDAFTGSQGFGREGADGALFGSFDSHTYGCFLKVNQGLDSDSATPCLDSGPGLLMTFDSAADFVEIAGVWRVDYTKLYAFDEDFNLIADSGSGFGLPRQGEFNASIATVTSATGRIKYAIAESVGGGISLDTLRYRTVPEPSSFALLALGVAGLLRAPRGNTSIRPECP